MCEPDSGVSNVPPCHNRLRNEELDGCVLKDHENDIEGRELGDHKPFMVAGERNHFSHSVTENPP
jgi:hypothetical protein